MRITFDKVELLCTGKYHTEAERKLAVPLNHHLEIGKVTQVGHTVTDFKVGEDVLFLTVSKNTVRGDKAYVRDREILFKLIKEEGKDDEFETTGNDVCVKIINQEQLKDSLIYMPNNVSTGVLLRAEVIWINPNNNELELKKGDKIFFKKNAGERRLIYNDTILLHDHQIVYVEDQSNPNI